MIRFIDQVELKGKPVLMRLDLNVPLDKSDNRTITDPTRIEEALPTIRYALEQGARLVLCSHLGRPGGKRDERYSLEPVAEWLAKELGREVTLVHDIVDDGVHQMIRHGKGGEVFLLENLRFHPGEEAGDPEFVELLASLADVYINDAFGTSHREHASTYGVAKRVGTVAAGFLIKKELEFLDKVVRSPEHPFVLVVGGAKVTDKLKAVSHLLNHVDRLIVGGAMSYAFLKAKSLGIGKSKCEEAGVDAAKAILEKAERNGVKVYLPVDHVAVNLAEDPEMQAPIPVDGANIPDDLAALDIGPRTITEFERALTGAKTVFWNGPMGFFEKDKYSGGTAAIAHAIGVLDAVKVAGGGDSVSAIKKLGDPAQYGLLSTGGGASLKYLEGNGLPGIKVLDRKQTVQKTGATSLEPGQWDGDAE